MDARGIYGERAAGKRVIKPTEEADFIYEEKLDEYLKWCGMTDEQLENDLRPSLSLEERPFRLDQFELTDGDKHYTICSDSGMKSGIYIVNWLNGMSYEKFMEYWNNKCVRPYIETAMRHPGGMHEWLMIQAMPLLKGMGINMEYVKTVRTATTECQFDYLGEICNHGSKGSPHMHRDLYMAIKSAADARTDPYNELLLLKEQLRIFSTKYYRETPIPEALKNFIEGK